MPESDLDLRWIIEGAFVGCRVVTNGFNGPEWIKNFRERSTFVGTTVASKLLSEDFFPTYGLKKEVKILQGDIFPDERRTTESFLKYAGKHPLQNSNLETLCLVALKFSPVEIKKLGFDWIAIISKENRSTNLVMGISINNTGDMVLSADVFPGDHRWGRNTGIMFDVL